MGNSQVKYTAPPSMNDKDESLFTSDTALCDYVLPAKIEEPVPSFSDILREKAALQRKNAAVEKTAQKIELEKYLQEKDFCPNIELATNKICEKLLNYAQMGEIAIQFIWEFGNRRSASDLGSFLGLNKLEDIYAFVLQSPSWNKLQKGEILDIFCAWVRTKVTPLKELLSLRTKCNVLITPSHAKIVYYFNWNKKCI